MTTFADVQKYAEDNGATVTTIVDKATPAGHFLALIRIQDEKRMYLLEGEKDSAEAVLKGHVLMNMSADSSPVVTGYFGGTLVDGVSLGYLSSYMGRFQSFESVFATMAKGVKPAVTNNGEPKSHPYGTDAHDGGFEGSTKLYAEHLVTDHGYTEAQVSPYSSGVTQGDWSMLDRLHRHARSLDS